MQLYRQWNLNFKNAFPAHQSTHSLHRDRGPLDVEQPPEAESIEDRIHLAGFDASSGKMHLRSNKLSAVKLYNYRKRFFHRFHRTRHQAGEDMLLLYPPTPVNPSVAHIESSQLVPDTSRLLQRTSLRGTEVSPQPVILRLTGSHTRLIMLLPRTSSVADRIRTELQLLDIPSRVTFKLCVLAYRCLHGSAPSYLVRYFTPVSAIAGRSHLRSAASGLLSVPRTNTSTIGPIAFAISSPSAWNCLPVDLRDPGHTLLTFRRNSKTHLFNLSVHQFI